MNKLAPPVVLAFSGHDPSGGAGVQADIESIKAMGCHPAAIITCHTVQDTENVYRMVPVNLKLIREQADVLFRDYAVAAIKVGLIGTPDTARLIAEIIKAQPACPVIVDTVLAAGGGNPLAGGELVRLLREELTPLAALLTPNSTEARRLGESEELDRCARRLLAGGAGGVLITGTHEAGEKVLNRFYRGDEPVAVSAWERLPGSYHGSGCTLASSIAACMARGHPLPTAVERGLHFTWGALKRGYRPGRGQMIPERGCPGLGSDRAERGEK